MVAKGKYMPKRQANCLINSILSPPPFSDNQLVTSIAPIANYLPVRVSDPCPYYFGIEPAENPESKLLYHQYCLT